jgi:hypothetical protein
MAELESIRSIAKRLVQQYREKRELRDVARIVDALPQPGPVLHLPPPVFSPFDLRLTDRDRAFLHSVGVRL